MMSGVHAQSDIINSTNTIPPIGVGFGTAGLGQLSVQSVLTALRLGFRSFDTAEESDLWYNQHDVGNALRQYYDETPASALSCLSEDPDRVTSCPSTTTLHVEPKFWASCNLDSLRISTKIPPWELTSESNIRARAKASREELVGFCSGVMTHVANPFDLSASPPVNVASLETTPYPLDVYYIHAPTCWSGWHFRCDGTSHILSLREAWIAMEAVVSIDKSAARIGLSNVSPEELLDIILFVKERQQQLFTGNNVANAAHANEGDPRMPDVLQSYADPLRPATELRKICKLHNIEFVSYSTLGTQHRQRINPVLASNQIVGISRRHGRSAAETVLSWAIQSGMSVIPRSSNDIHITELSNLLHEPPFLAMDDLLRIDSIALN